MNKKVLLLTVLLSVSISASVFAYGIGLQLDAGFAEGKTGLGPAVTFKLDEFPMVFAVNLDVTENYFSLGVTADWWFFNNQIAESLPLKWYVGYGLFTRIGLGEPGAFIAGGRLPVGINAFLADGFFEPFLQIAPSVGIAFAPSFHFPEWFVPVSLGGRFWF